MTMTSTNKNQYFGPPPPFTKLTAEQDFRVRQLEVMLPKDEVDKKDIVKAFGASSGVLIWQQEGLKLRSVSSPVTIDKGIVIGDFEGYIHLLDARDGSFIGRTKVSRKPIKEIVLKPKEIKSLQNISDLTRENGNTDVKIIIKDDNKEITFILKNKRKIDIKSLESLKNHAICTLIK